MSPEQAQSAVSLSAFVVAVIFAYRKLIEQGGASSNPVPSTGHFVIGFGFTFVILSLFAQGAPTLGGMMAILVATGDLLVNGQPLAQDLSGALKATQGATASTAPSVTRPGPTPVAQATAAPGHQNTPGL